MYVWRSGYLTFIRDSFHTGSKFPRKHGGHECKSSHEESSRILRHKPVQRVIYYIFCVYGRDVESRFFKPKTPRELVASDTIKVENFLPSDPRTDKTCFSESSLQIRDVIVCIEKQDSFWREVTSAWGQNRRPYRITSDGTTSTVETLLLILSNSQFGSHR